MGRAQRARDAARALRSREQASARERRAERDPDAQRVAGIVYAAVLDAKALTPHERSQLPPGVFGALTTALHEMAAGWIRAHGLPETEEMAQEVTAWLLHTVRDTAVLAGPAIFRDWQERMAAFEELGADAAAAREGDDG
jgi:hypothetical protein